MWWRGDIYEKRFLCGVEGVKLEGREGGGLFGGVCDRVLSRACPERDEPGILLSGDNVGGVTCGIVPSNNSALNNVEKVRFASSASYS